MTYKVVLLLFSNLIVYFPASVDDSFIDEDMNEFASICYQHNENTSPCHLDNPSIEYKCFLDVTT